jgi:hypothetical protein
MLNVTCRSLQPLQQSSGFNPNAREFVPYPASSSASSDSGYQTSSPSGSPTLSAQFPAAGPDPTDDQLQLAQAALKKNRGLKPGVCAHSSLSPPRFALLVLFC